MNHTVPCFSPDYLTARRRFREGVAVPTTVDSLELAAKGPRHEDLTIDIGRFGTAQRSHCRMPTRLNGNEQ